MRYTLFFLFGLILFFIQENFFRFFAVIEYPLNWFHLPESYIHLPGMIPSLILPVILYMGVHEFNLFHGAQLAFLLGYFSDLLGMNPVGLYTFLYVTLFVVARIAGLRLASQTAWSQILLGFGFTLLKSSSLLVLLAIFGTSTWVPKMLYKLALPHSLLTALVTPFLFFFCARIEQWSTKIVKLRR